MLLTLTLIGFLTLAAGLAVRWVLHRVDALGRVAPFPKISVGLSLALALSCAVPLAVQGWVESRLERAAVTVAGGPVTVHCQGLGQAFLDLGPELGFVRWGTDGVPERSTLIKRSPCAHLRAWLWSATSHPTLDQVIAVHVLTHEAMHLAGHYGEAEAECLAMQHDSEMAQLLGATPENADALARSFWVNVYPRMAGDYVSAGCTADGPLDESPGDQHWP